MTKIWVFMLSLSFMLWGGVVIWWQVVGGFSLMICLFMILSMGDCLLLMFGFEMFSDVWSLGLILITFWIGILTLVGGYKLSGSYYNNKYLGALVSFLTVILLASFSEASLLGFYFFFESSLIPMLLIILGFGYQPERLQAGLYFIFYTLGASLPLLFFITYYYFSFGESGIYLWLGSYLGDMSLLVGLTVVGAFLVKMPMFFTHLWLPSAHVEAPVSGSMILAGVLLKLGGYGLGRVGSSFGGFPMSGAYIIGLSLMGMVVVGLICCQMSDLKALVAYSSVVHMGLVLCGLFSGYKWGLLGASMMMVGHGLCSSGLFYMINIYYERSFSRSMLLNSGMITIFPVATLGMFMLCGGNFSVPLTINFFSEIYLMGALLGFETLMMLVFPLGSFLGVVFTMFLFSITQHGSSNLASSSVYSLSGREMLILYLHLLPLNLLFLNLGLVF